MKKIKEYLLWLVEINNLKNYLMVFSSLSVIIGLIISYGFLTNRPKIKLIPHNPVVIVDFIKFNEELKKNGCDITIDLEKYTKYEGLRSASIKGNLIKPYFICHYLDWYDKSKSNFYDKYDKKAIQAKDFDQNKFNLSILKCKLGYEKQQDETALSPSNMFNSPINFLLQLQLQYGYKATDNSLIEFFKDILNIEIRKITEINKQLIAYKSLSETRYITLTPFEIKNIGKSDAIDIPISINMSDAPGIGLLQEVIENQVFQIDNIKKRLININISCLKPGQNRLIVFKSKNQPATSELLSVGMPKYETIPNFNLIWISFIILIIIVIFFSIRDFHKTTHHL
ncbi:MAG: hypothetical protein WC947_06240 [Elusimicrobiota bacterium]